MRGLSAADLLTAWEQGVAQHPLDRALTLLGTALPETGRRDLAALTAAQRDALLFGLHSRTFGEQLEGCAQCPACAERVEFELPAAEIAAGVPEQRALSIPAPATLEVAGFGLLVRLPDSRDLAAIVNAPDAADATARLLRRCVLRAEYDGAELDAADLPAEVVEEVDAWMAAQDPLGNVTLDLCCAACGHGWEAALDIVEFLWTEVAARAQRLLGEVHALAKAYGWHEADILAMGPARRQGYLELVGAT